MSLSSEHLLWGLLVLNYALCSLLRDSAMVVLPPLMVTLSLSASAVGFISSIYHYAYGSVQSISGTACDRWGAVRLCGASLSFCIIGLVFFAIGTTPTMMACGRLLMGFGMGPAFAAVLVFQAQAFPAKDYPIYAALSTIISNLGNVVAISPLGFALDFFGKGKVFISLALFTFLLSVVMLLCSFRYEEKRPKGHAFEKLKLSGLLCNGFVCISKDIKLFSVTLFWCVSMGMQLAFLGLWGVPWYETVWNLSLVNARQLMTFSAFSVMVGALVGGLLGRRLCGDKTTVLAAYIMMLCSWTVLIVATLLNASLLWGILAAILIGFFSGNCNVLCSSYIRALPPINKLGAVLGSVSMSIFIAGIIYQWGAGIIMSYAADGGNAVITTEGFLYSFGSFISVAYLFVPLFLNAHMIKIKRL